MGFPVFNVFFGFIAGYYFGKRIYSKKVQPDMQSKLINQVALFTGLIMTLICISSGYIALKGQGVGGDIQKMFGLGFEVTKTMILCVALIGGFSLILTQILLTKKVIIMTIKYITTH